ncbi:cytochrome P450 [Glomus cerebriforme]|uniref:Cytochrome P450 n=1 Tax=Glomus cerebriforme TaxID=658196 RepID=A0A397SMW6_9GLOM|nr:cytochrome P450 [Glomus cerebriforme]
MIDFNQIFSKLPEYNISDFYDKFLILTALCLIIPSLYFLYIKRKNTASLSKVAPKQTIIIHEKNVTNTITGENSSTKDDENFDIASCGGFIPYLRRLHANQGAHVLSPKLPYPNTISVVDPITVKAILSIGDRPVDLFKFLEPFLGEDNLQIFDADRAASFRKLVGPALGHDVIVTKYPSMRDIGVEFIERWEKLVMNDKDSVIKMQDECLEFSLRVVLNAVISIDESTNLDAKSYKKFYDIALSALFDKQSGLLDTSREEEFQQAVNYLKSFTVKLINQRKEKLLLINDAEKTRVKDLFDILLTENDPYTEKPFTDEAIISRISGYIMAGYHTTGVAIPYTLLALSQNYDVQIKLQEEIDQTLEGHLPSLNDLSKMEYLTQVVKESLRVHPPGSFCARLLKSETALPTMVESKNLTVQANTSILYPIPLYHENPNFHSQPEKFDPTRFSPDKIKDIKPNTYCPFGFGARICPGDRIAMVDMKMLVCLILQKFNVELAMKLEDIVKEERFVVMAKNDVLIKLVSRGAKNY